MHVVCGVEEELKLASLEQRAWSGLGSGLGLGFGAKVRVRVQVGFGLRFGLGVSLAWLALGLGLGLGTRGYSTLTMGLLTSGPAARVRVS